METIHNPVLLKPTINALLQENFSEHSAFESCNTNNFRKLTSNPSIFVDGTFGCGGHSRELLRYLPINAKLFVFDKDPASIRIAKNLENEDNRVKAIHGSFTTIFSELFNRGIKNIDGMILDLGISTAQINDAKRGFSFKNDGPLDMRMDTTKGYTVADWLEKAKLDEIWEVIRKYGQERFAFQIAKAIINRRKKYPFLKTLDLAQCIAKTVRTREYGKHPARRTFQALRIYINQEIDELIVTLRSIIKILRPTGRLAIISFHSIEDRIVKQYIKTNSNPPIQMLHLPLRDSEFPKSLICPLGRILPDETEISKNPKGRSAVLRVAMRKDIVSI